MRPRTAVTGEPGPHPSPRASPPGNREAGSRPRGRRAPEGGNRVRAPGDGGVWGGGRAAAGREAGAETAGGSNERESPGREAEGEGWAGPRAGRGEGRARLAPGDRGIRSSAPTRPRREPPLCPGGCGSGRFGCARMRLGNARGRVGGAPGPLTHRGAAMGSKCPRGRRAGEAAERPGGGRWGAGLEGVRAASFSSCVFGLSTETVPNS